MFKIRKMKSADYDNVYNLWLSCAGMGLNILDFGFWTKSERDEFRRRAHSFGAHSKIHYMDVPNDIIWERLSVRNKLAGKNAVFYVGKEEFDEWSGLFEIPTKEELQQ